MSDLLNTDLYKVVHIGKSDEGGVFCKISITNGNLSISGVIGPMRNGDARGSCGQIDMGEWGITKYAPGWDEIKEAAFRAAWGHWHLNDMRAGNQEQEDFLHAHPFTVKYPESHYEKACEMLKEAGLNPAPDGYKYGSKWLKEELPQSVYLFLRDLPDTDIKPVWI